MIRPPWIAGLITTERPMPAARLQHGISTSKTETPPVFVRAVFAGGVGQVQRRRSVETSADNEHARAKQLSRHFGLLPRRRRRMRCRCNGAPSTGCRRRFSGAPPRMVGLRIDCDAFRVRGRLA